MGASESGFFEGGILGGVMRWLEEQLQFNDGRSMMEAKRLMNWPLREGRMMAIHDATDALAERFVDGAPLQRMAAKRAQLQGES